MTTTTYTRRVITDAKIVPQSVHMYAETDSYRFLRRVDPIDLRMAELYAGADPETGDFVPFKFLGFVVLKMNFNDRPTPIHTSAQLFDKYDFTKFSEFDSLSSKEDGQVLLSIWANISGEATLTNLFYHHAGEWRFGTRKTPVEFWRIQEML